MPQYAAMCFERMFSSRLSSTILGMACLWALFIQPVHGESSSGNDRAPNILLIIADDLGYSDLGSYGGEIVTPSLDALAESGIRLSNFHAHYVCTPTRAMLYTGVNNHAAGIGTMAGEQRGAQINAQGYEAYLTDRVLPISHLFQDAGYLTFISGKWDMGGRNDERLLPGNRGFDRHFVLVEGSADHFRDFPALAELPDVNYRLDGEVYELPPDFYSSTAYTQEFIGFVDEALNEDQPFFGVLSFTAPHYPIQAPARFIEPYRGLYSAGYDPVRQARLQRQQDIGMIAPDLLPAPPERLWPEWDALDQRVRKLEAARMEAYAGMVTAMDHAIGELLEHLVRRGVFGNTLIVFMSDNGAEGGNVLDWGDEYFDWADEHFDNSLENTGLPGSFTSYGPQWAHVSSAPWRLSKGFPTEGGTRVPLIASWPGHVPGGRISHGLATVLDLPLALLELAGIEHPGRSYRGRPVRVPEGRSMAPLLLGQSESIRKADDVIVWEILDRKAIRKGDWKLVSINRPWGAGKGKWSLFNILEDPTEQLDLSDQLPGKVAELLQDWADYIKRNGVIIPADFWMGYTNSLSHFYWLPPDMRTAEEQKSQPWKNMELR